jgi:hypothetical protein
VPRGTVPAGGRPYRVQDGDSWQSLAAKCGMDTWALIRYNYPSLSPDNRLAVREVNWYLRWYVGCFTVTAGATNYIFSSRDNPGIVYLPPARVVPDFTRFNKALAFIYNRMMIDAQSTIAMEIRTLNDAAKSPLLIVTSTEGAATVKGSAYALWFWMVRPHGDWDYKAKLLKEIGGPKGDFHFPIMGDNDHEYFYDIWSNIHYAYVGRAAGFSRYELDNGHQIPIITGSTDDIDVETVRIGLDLWDRYALNLTTVQLHQAILARTKRFLEIQKTKRYVDQQKGGKDPNFTHVKPISNGL